MKRSALRRRRYADSDRATNSVQQKKSRHLTSLSVKHTDDHVQHTDEVKVSADTSLRFSQDHLEREISKQLEEAFSEYGIDIDDAVCMDWSAEATAKRVFDLSTGLFEVWRAQHMEMNEEELTDHFEETIRDAIDQGYSQAVDILSSVELDDSVLETAVETISLLHKMLNEHFTDLRAQLEEREE